MDIDRDELLGIASQRTGQTNFGAPPFAEGLDVLLEALRGDDRIPESGRIYVTERLLAPLVQRLQLYGDRAIHPEISAQRIERPIIVIGLPRSGTTILHSLLAQDPGARALMPWQIGNPSPPPRQETLATDPRIAEAEAAMAQVPISFQRIHMVGATLPDECNNVAQMSFASTNLMARFDVPAYEKWYLKDDGRASFAVHRHVLQHLQAFTEGTHWVLKSPPHMFALPALIEAYPDARIVFPHREPAQTLPSFVSLIAYLRGMLYPQVDRTKIGARMLAIWAEAIDRTLSFRDDPEQAGRFVDISYEQLVTAPMTAVRHVYESFGMDLSPEAERAMLRFLANQPKDKHGTHRYSLEEAGLSRSLVDTRFRKYIDRHLT